MAAPPAGRLERFLKRPRAWVWIAALAVLLGLPSLRVGFYSDDYAQISMVEHRILDLRSSTFDLYRMVGDDPAELRGFVARGPLPWWTDAAFRLHFFRPLTSALFALDHAIHGHSPAGYHVTTILAYALAIVALGALYRRALPGEDRARLSVTAALALLLFAVDDTHAQVLAWIACRHLSVTAIPALLGLAAHLRFREEGWKPGRWLGPLGLATAFLCGESAVGGVAYWLSYDLLGPAPPGVTGSAERRSRVVAALPALAILGAYAVAYKTLGYGVRGSGAYIDPAAYPLDFAAALVWRLPALVGDFFTGFTADLTAILPRTPFLVVGAVSTAAMALLYRAVRSAVPESERVALRWLLPGALAGLVVSSGGFVGSRLLFFPSVGGAVLIAVLLRASARRIAEETAGVRKLGLRVARGLLVAVHLVFPPLLTVNGAFMLAGITQRGADAARRAEVELEGPRPAHIVLVWASDPMVSFYTPILMIFDHPPHPGNMWHILTTGKGSHRVTRTGTASLKIESLGGPMLRGAFDQIFYKPERRFQVGERFDQEGMTVAIVAAEDGAPTAIEARFEVPLEDPNLYLVAWLDGKLRRITVPPEGESMVIDWSPGPFQIF